eukprot:4650517-Pyramimonas_sp.AAC.1
MSGIRNRSYRALRALRDGRHGGARAPRRLPPASVEGSAGQGRRAAAECRGKSPGAGMGVGPHDA